MGRILSYQQIKNYIEVESDSGCKLLSTEKEFEEEKVKQGKIGAKVQLRIKCKCGEEFDINYSNFKSKEPQRRCPLCRENVKWDIYWIKRYTDKFTNCKLISNEYVDCYTPMKWECACGKHFNTSITCFQMGKQYCDDCGKENRVNHNPNRWTKENIIKYIEDNSKCKVINADVKNIVVRELKITCEDCGKPFLISFDEFIHAGRRRCKSCGYKLNAFHRTKTHEEFMNSIPKKWLEEYEVLEEYNGKDAKIKFKHKKCGRTFRKSPTKFLDGQMCPFCASSKGENKIAEILFENNIEFDTQIKFDDLRGKNKQYYKYDVGIYSKNKLIKLIEYHGIQHYEPVEIFGGEKDFVARKESDKLKEKYCKNNNIELLIIPYWDYDNIKQILEEKLNKHYLFEEAI